MNICVYGAASDNITPVYIHQVEKLGELMAENGHGLIFGAGAHGLMGAVARGVHAKGGRIVGIVPRFFQSEGIIFPYCTELHRTDTMRTRKQMMEERADAFVMVPGGIGTYEEFFEILTLKQLGRHGKPIAILNVNGYFEPLRALLAHTITEGFLSERCWDLFHFCEKPEEILATLTEAQPPCVPLKPV